MVGITLETLKALDAVLDLAADVLDGTVSATSEERTELSRELLKCRGMVLEAIDQHNRQAAA